MNKIPRFVTEYANFSKKSVEACELMQECFKKEKIRQIENAVTLLRRGLITIGETMQLINEA